MTCVLLPNALGTLHHKGQAIVRKTRRNRTPRKLRIVYAAAEALPFVKVGGLADVAGALPKVLARLGHDICVMLTKYAQIDEHAFGLTGPLFSQVIPMAGEFQEAHIYQSSAIQNVQVLFVANHTYFLGENSRNDPGLHGGFAAGPWVHVRREKASGTPSGHAAGFTLMVYRKEAEWQALIKRAMKADYLWAEPANAYETLYHNALS
jgi:glycogen synthase